MLESDQDLVRSAFAAADNEQASSPVPKKKRKIKAAEPAVVSDISIDAPVEKENIDIELQTAAPRRSKRQR